MDFGLVGKVALVTGGSQGIGQAIAESLGTEGAAVAVTYQANAALAESVAARIRSRGGEACTCALDLSSRESIAAAVESVTSRWGRIDVLVNNAVDWGPRTMAAATTFDQQPFEEWAPLLRSNIEGALTAIHLVAPQMKVLGWGRIVNISSSVVESGAPGTAWYSAAKAALHGVTRSLAKELDPYGVLINVVMPGPTRTPRVDRVYPALVRAHETSRSVKRLLEPSEIAPLVVFLASAANSIVTGQIIGASGTVVSPPSALTSNPIRATRGQAVTPADK